MRNGCFALNSVAKSGDTMSGPLNMGANTINGVANGVAGQDAVTLAQVQNLIAAIHPASILTGTYTGDGTTPRNINIGVNLAAMTNVYVIIKGAGTNSPVHRTEYGQGDLTMLFSNVADAAGLIKAFTSTGFQIGSVSQVNTNGTVYRYIVIYTN